MIRTFAFILLCKSRKRHDEFKVLIFSDECRVYPFYCWYRKIGKNMTVEKVCICLFFFFTQAFEISIDSHDRSINIWHSTELFVKNFKWPWIKKKHLIDSNCFCMNDPLQLTTRKLFRNEFQLCLSSSIMSSICSRS